MVLGNFRRERLVVICTVVGIVGSLLIPFHPVNSGIVKLVFLGCVVVGWVGLLFVVWRMRVIRVAVMVFPLLGMLPLMLPGGEVDEGELREEYVRRLSGFEGVKYFWGGESSWGIDCSGLPRRALRDAMLAYGVRHLNGRAFRGYVEQWWYDASAKALGEGYRDYTVALDRVGTIRTMSYDGLLPGDLAVTTNGVHVLVYLGEGKWIQADPGVGEVVIDDGRTSENSWLSAPVTMHRWEVLD